MNIRQKYSILTVLVVPLLLGGRSNQTAAQSATTTPAAPAALPSQSRPKTPSHLSFAAPEAAAGLQLAAVADNSAESYGGFGGGGFGGVLRSAAARDTVPPVLIHFSTTDPAGAQNLEEDLAIMNHIIDQALERGLGEDAPPSKMGVPLLYTSSGRSTRAIYLGGFGPVFMVKVNMPLMAPSSPAEEKPSQSAVDTEWESAKRELFGGPKPGSLMVSVTVPEVPFDAEQVDILKRTLINAFKNASNIRGLKADEFVSIAVFGQPVPPAATPQVSLESRHTSDQPPEDSSRIPKVSAASRSSKSGRKSSGKSTTSIVMSDALALGGASQKGTVLTLRAKASDITAFAQSKLSVDDFAKKVTTTVYAGSGYGVTSVNSWIQSGRSTVR